MSFPTITDDALASLRALIGRPVRRPEPYIEVANRDAIRHWAHGIGDRNPFWAGGRVAPPTILFAMDRIVSGYVGGLPGIHAMYGGTDFRWRRAIREDDRVTGASVLLDLEDKASAFARRSIKQTYRTTFTTDDGAVVCEADSWCFRTERDTARERQKYGGALEPHRYSAEAVERIRDGYRNEQVRGASTRHWEDVRVGEAVPAAYDYGPERVAWLGHLVTNWMGDAGTLARLSVQVRRHNLIGDTTWCRGVVANTALVDGRGEVTLDLAAVNQRDETIASGQAVVILPRRV